MQLPLGLELESLHLQGRELEEAVNELDSEGWNTSDSLRDSQWTRAALIVSMIREDILELSLGALPHGDLAFAQ